MFLKESKDTVSFELNEFNTFEVINKTYGLPSQSFLFSVYSQHIRDWEGKRKGKGKK